MLIGKSLRIIRNEGFAAWVRRIKERVLLRLEVKHTVTNVTHKEAFAFFELRKRTYDELISAVLPHVDRDAVIFDIGANIGYFTYRLAQRLNFTGSLYLFEPVPQLAELCKTTFRDVPYHAKVLNFGLSDKNSEADIYISNEGNLGWNTFVAQMTTPDMTTVRVQLRTFDDCGIDVTPALIKIDVEGAEYLVFRGMLGSLKKWQPLPVVLCEISWGKNHPKWAEELSVLAELKQLGYDICGLDGSPIDEHNLQGSTDVLLLPRKS